MTPNEFKAWFDGFTEAFDGKIPTKTQWDRIKARVAEIDGRPVTKEVYVDRYWPTYVKAYPSYPITTFTTTCASGAVSGSSTYSLSNSSQAGYADSVSSFDSAKAMLALGRAEASSIS